MEMESKELKTEKGEEEKKRGKRRSEVEVTRREEGRKR